MTLIERLMRSGSIEAPTVDGINFQVRTGVSVPFAPHMLGGFAEAPSVDSTNFQVRTGVSVPFAPHMRGKAETPRVDGTNFQVRTGVSVPFNPDMVDEQKAEASRTVTIPFAGFMLSK